MTNTKLRIAVAKAQGWTSIYEDIGGELVGILKHAGIIPNYPGSMDACEPLEREVIDDGFSISYYDTYEGTCCYIQGKGQMFKCILSHVKKSLAFCYAYLDYKAWKDAQ